MDVHIDPLEPTPHLYIVGAGHVGWHLGRLAARGRLPHPRRRRPREVRQPRALSRRGEVVVGADPGMAASRRPAGDRLRRRRHARTHARPRRDARAGGARLQVSRPDRQPRQGRAHLRRCCSTKACRPNASSACTRRSASTSAPSRRRRSPSASSRELIAVRRGVDTSASSMKRVSRQVVAGVHCSSATRPS